MARIKTGILSHKRRKKILKLAKGYYGAKSKQFRTANQAVMKAGLHAYIGRKNKKRDFRRLWILRISAACKLNNVNYSRFINGLKKSGTELNRKILSEIAISDPQGFSQLVEKSKSTSKLHTSNNLSQAQAKQSTEPHEN